VFVYASVSLNKKTTAPSPGSDFIEEARALADKQPEWQGEGTIAPVKDDPDAPKPVIELSHEKELDLGLVPNSNPTTGQITVYNKGKGLLVINRINSSCGCTKGTMAADQKRIPPGGSGIIEVTLLPQYVHTFESRKNLFIFSNDPERPRIDIDVVAEIDPEFVLEPDKINFGTVAKGTKAEHDIIVRQLSPEPFAVTDIRVLGRDTNDIVVSFEKRPESQWTSSGHAEYVIHAALPEDVSPGNVSGRFLIMTSCKRVPSVAVDYEGKVLAPYRIEPPGPIVLSTKQGDETSDESRQPTHTTIVGEGPIEVVDVSCTSTDFTAAAHATETANSVIIEITANTELRPSPRTDYVKFTVKAGSGSFRDKIPVRISLRPPRKLRKPFLDKTQPANQQAPNTTQTETGN